MEQEKVVKSEIKLIGITARTNNASEMNPTTAKISMIVQKYFYGGLSEKILHRKNPGITYSVYTEYESDMTGDYTYFLGEEVLSFDNILEGFFALTIPIQHYVKFTDGPGAMPGVCINLWQKIWQLNPGSLGGIRGYIADFELYDERAANSQSTVLDIYIGIK